MDAHLPAAAGNSLGVLDWFWTYKLTRHAHCIGTERGLVLHAYRVAAP